MKKIVLIYSLTWWASILCINNVPEDSQERLPIQEQTFLVYRRYYFVARLDKTIQLLAKMYHDVSAMQGMLADKHIAFDEIVPEETYRLFTHKQIRQSVKEISHTRSLKPLFMVWDSFKSYKSLRDDLLVEDFSKEIFIITRNTIDSLHKHDVLRLSREEHPLQLEDRLNALANLTDVLQNTLAGHSDQMTARATEMGNIHLSVHTDEVAFRFYCVRRLRTALDYLLSYPDSDQSMGILCEALQNKSSCLQNKAYRKLLPKQKLKRLWNDVVQYKYIENDDFMHSFAVYTLMLMHCRTSDRQLYKNFSHADLIAMQHRIEQLPIEEILKTIDIIVKQVHTAVDHYHKSGLTLTQWIKRYWWAPTAICTTVAIKCFLIYYKNFRTS